MSCYRIVQPQIKAHGCGVSDHSGVLVRLLKESAKHAERYAVPNRHACDAVPVVAGDVWILQVSIYGFSGKGVPLWLPTFIEAARARGVRVIACFHELWVLVAPGLSTAYWLAPLQRRICERLASLADYAFFNCDWAYSWGVERLGARAFYAPTFSNVGEPPMVTPWRERENLAVVFGSPLTRARVYAQAVPALAKQLDCARIERVIDIGSPGPWIDEVVNAFKPHAFESAGPLPAEDVSRLLMRAKWGLFNTPWGQASKSGVFAAYASHGVAPVSIFDDALGYPAPSQYPLPERHFMTHGAFADADDSLDTLSSEIGARVYVEHARSRQLVEKIVELTS
ncbi:hypothetical protein [Paraburkholderia adhaesiva]|uniref:hypothetical protein n=1 Tax=Paraburkholderia adhaesiva TaxID=2883244 RepID=UPI001F3BED4B|nr:hypothetical protein [Paraburkholderia adhaesiva]